MNLYFIAGMVMGLLLYLAIDVIVTLNSLKRNSRMHNETLKDCLKDLKKHIGEINE